MIRVWDVRMGSRLYLLRCDGQPVFGGAWDACFEQVLMEADDNDVFADGRWVALVKWWRQERIDSALACGVPVDGRGVVGGELGKA